MNKIKAAIIEDEIPAARLLRDTLLSLRPGWDVELLPGNIEEAVEWFAQHRMATRFSLLKYPLRKA